MLSPCYSVFKIGYTFSDFEVFSILRVLGHQALVCGNGFSQHSPRTCIHSQQMALTILWEQILISFSILFLFLPFHEFHFLRQGIKVQDRGKISRSVG